MTSAEIAMVLASALLHAIWSAAIKGSRQAVAFNLAQVGLLCVAALAAAGGGFRPADLSPPVLGLLAATGVAHGLYFFTLSRALERADLSRVYPVVRSTPAFLPLVAVPWLGERLTPVGAVGIAVVVAGVWAVGASGGGGLRVFRRDMWDAWLALATTVAYSLLDKRAMAELGGAPWHGVLPRSVSWFLLTSAASALVFVPLALATGRPGLLRAARRELPGAALAVLVSGIGYGLILEAYETAPASYVVAVRQVSVLFALGIAVVFLRERPDRARVLGATATVAGVALIAWGG